MDSSPKTVISIEEDVQVLKDRIRALEQVLKEKDEHLSIIKHNLQGPSVVYQNLVLLMDLYVETEAWTEIPPLLSAYKHTIEKFDNLIQKLFTYSISRSPDLQMPMRDIELKPMLAHILPMWEDVADLKHIKISWHCPKGIFIHASEELLEVALGVVLENAIRYSPDNSQITVEAQENQDQVEIAISDQGKGWAYDIPERFGYLNKHKIKSDTNKKNSDGLGLLTVQKWIESTGGTIFAEEITPNGSCVTLGFPTVD